MIDPDPDTDTTGDSNTLEDKELGADREALTASAEKELRNLDEILVNLYDNLRYLNIKYDFTTLNFSLEIDTYIAFFECQASPDSVFPNNYLLVDVTVIQASILQNS